MNHRSVNRRAIEQSMGQVGRSEGTGRPNTKPKHYDGTPQGFVEDFNLEHSVSGAGRSIRTISGSRNRLEPSPHRASQMQDLKPPNCIYLG
jgi:hypothetical protein